MPAKLLFDQSSNPQSITEIPVYFSVFRSSDGQVGGNLAGFTNGDAENQLNFINSKFSGSGLHFYRLGNVNYIDNDLLQQDAAIVRNTYSYVYTAMNAVIGLGPTNGIQPGENLFGAPVKYNTTNLAPNFIGQYVHELGHNFGLLHTHGPLAAENAAPILFDYPKVLDPVLGLTVYDHPYQGNRRRELAIRQLNPNKPFDLPNCHTAGDFCCDTDADCIGGFPRTFPDFETSNVASCLQNGPCLDGCSNSGCTHNGPYRDYNGDPIPGCFNNIMSYNIGAGCGSYLFTAEQSGWIGFHYNNFYSNWLDDLLTNVNDKVEFHGSTTPMRNVVIRWRHTSDPIRYTNCTSNTSGDFQGVLYTDPVKAEVRKIGSIKEIAGTFQAPGQPVQPYYKDAYNYADWIKDVDIKDIFKIHKHVVGNFNLNGDGYNLIAADADHSNSITANDVVVLKQLLFSRVSKLSAFDAPWRFLPEYIPQNHSAEFNSNPFNMDIPTINGQSPVGTPYTEPSWEYIIPGDANMRGYDGIKIGDVFGDPSFPPACEVPAVLSFPNAPLLAPNQNFDITLKASGFTDVESFQMGMFVDHTQLEVLDVSSSSLPEFDLENNVGMQQLENDQLNILWFQSNAQPVTLSSQVEFIRIKVKALQPVTNLSGAFNLEGNLPDKFIKASSCDGMALPLLGLVEPSPGTRPSGRSMDEHIRQTTLYCYPIPVSDVLNVSFEQGIAGQGILRFSNVSGKILFSKSLNLEAGINTVSLHSGDLSGLPAGVLVASLQTNTGLQSGRFVKL
ncbi:MAG: hypothetical protein ACKVT2_16745 [Saprospiraceae bacterium]